MQELLVLRTFKYALMLVLYVYHNTVNEYIIKLYLFKKYLED